LVKDGKRHFSAPSAIAQATAGGLAMLASFLALGFARANWPAGLLAMEMVAVSLLVAWLFLLGRVRDSVRPGQTVWAEITFGIVISTRVLAIAIVMALLIAYFLVGPYPAEIGRFMAIVLIGGVIAVPTARLKLRRRRAAIVLGYLEQAARLNLPLESMILAAAHSERGEVRSILLNLHDELERGVVLDVALQATVAELSVNDILAISAAQNVHRLAHTLARLNGRGQENDFTVQHNGVYLAYPIVIVFGAALMAIFALPKYRQIMREFHIEGPWTARALGAVSNAASDHLTAIAGIAALLLAIWAAIFKGGRYFARLADLRDWILNLMPVIRGLNRNRALADLCDFAADAIASDSPLDSALRQAALAQPDAVVRRRALLWAERISAGQTVPDAARAAGLPTAMVRGLALARDTDDFVNALGFLSQHYEFQFQRTRGMVDALFVPAVVFVMGVAVAFMGLALFQPLAMLDSRSVYPIGRGF
jgi:type II secretory pathway component PulF